MNLQAIATSCHLTGQAFEEGQRVASVLVDDGKSEEVLRFDMLESEAGNFLADGRVVCRWVQVFKPRKAEENPERELKFTAENLFLTLMDPSAELSPDNVPLVQFLTLMLERKKLLRPKGKTADGAKNIFEHAKSKVLYEVPVGELTPEFFLSIQEQIGALLGVRKKEESPVEEEGDKVPPAEEETPVEESQAAGEETGER